MGMEWSFKLVTEVVIVESEFLFTLKITLQSWDLC